MVLRDCTTNTFNLDEIERFTSRKWDILAMKMCEDYDRKCVLLIALPATKLHFLAASRPLSSSSGADLLCQIPGWLRP